jgi:hypothetical protein
MSAERTTGPDTTMWEVRCVEGAVDALVDWLRTALGQECGALAAATVYTAADDRVVVIARGVEGAPRLPEAPVHLVRRPAHQWQFEQVADLQAPGRTPCSGGRTEVGDG